MVVVWWVAGCLDAPLEPEPPAARVVISWDPLACGEPHRVAVELEDDGGARVSASTPCARGGLALDVIHFGIFHGRIYAWVAGQPVRSITPVRIAVDAPLVRWHVVTPP